MYQMAKTSGAFGMPTTATTVSATLQNLVRNWINGGALP
jgi:hypothetical protein